MRRMAIVSLACLAAMQGTGVLRAQDTPTFRTGTTLIEFTMVAVDGNGRAVTDLRREEITIEENGRVRDIAFFRFEGGEAAAVVTVPPPHPALPTLHSNRIELGPGPRRNVIAILLDSLNTPATEQVNAREEVLRYLRTVTAGTRVAVYRLGSGFDVIHDFSDDLRLRSLLAATSAKIGMTRVSSRILSLKRSSNSV